jgi:hypothetical protein
METSALLSHDDRLQITNRVLAIIKTAAGNSMSTMASAQRKLAAYSDSTIMLIGNSTLGYETRNVLIEAVISETDEATVRETLFLHVHCPETVAPIDYRSHELIGIIRGLHELERFKNRKLDELTGEDLTVAIGVMNFVAVLRRNSYSGMHITHPDYVDESTMHIADPALRELVAETHPDQHEAILRLIQERGIDNAPAIETLLRDMEGTTVPLQNGLL